MEIIALCFFFKQIMEFGNFSSSLHIIIVTDAYIVQLPFTYLMNDLYQQLI